MWHLSTYLITLKFGKTITYFIKFSKKISNYFFTTTKKKNLNQNTHVLLVISAYLIVSLRLFLACRYDSRVRDLLDFSIYLDISNEVKFAWKIQVNIHRIYIIDNSMTFLFFPSITMNWRLFYKKYFRETWQSVDTVLKASRLALKQGSLILKHILVINYDSHFRDIKTHLQLV